MSGIARGTFEIDLKPVQPELDGAVGRFEFSKIFTGDLSGHGQGVMLSAGDPASGSAGYVALETVTGQLGEREGTFAMQQFGTMRDGSQTMYYDIVPGSGQAGLAGITGTLRLNIDQGGHHYELVYEL